ncbi:putative bifunctional diguanylate cyclase/phosphodiesterase [Geoalkalibacter sp.]|uniref:putative bifunctional diguanylate cyclase/phosphodiesterase n=1 Tax=Geoalkalibacter sp. TaxID=3041440 RepID=UPI00272DCCDC|nr:EAL domain-containing protein [Geoalkalibacter sp.]
MHPSPSLAGRRWIVSLLLLTAAPLANLTPLDIPLVFLFFPGNILALLALRLLGPAWGLATAASANSVVPLLVGHPYAPLWFIAEVAFIAWLEQRRHNRNLIFGSALYWGLLGSPLVLLSFLLMGADFQVGLLIAAKNCVNGIANAAIASLVLLLPLRRWFPGIKPQERMSLSLLLQTLMIDFLVLPGVAMTGLYLKSSVVQLQGHILEDLREKGLRLTQGIAHLPMPAQASAAGDFSPETLGSLKNLLSEESRIGEYRLRLLAGSEILLAAGPGVETGPSYDPGAGAQLRPLGGNVFHRVPRSEKFSTPISERWRRSSYLLLLPVDNRTDLRLVVEKSIAPLLAELREIVTRSFFVLTTLTYVCLALAWLLGRRVATPLGTLSQATHGIPARLEQGETDPDWPASPIREIHDLIHNCREMTASLRDKFTQIRLAHHNLEERVDRRTRELAEANADLLRKEARLEQLAHHDPLTDLPNRLLFQDRLEHALAKAHREGHQVALFFLDLDRFKKINDSLGHALGDHLLREVAQRLSGCVRAGDTVARLGGDEFMIVIDAVDNLQQVAAIAQKILRHLDRPVEVDGYSLYATGSIGVSLFPNDGRDVDTLMKCADAAMYRAKELGRNTYQFYTADMNARAHELLLLESSLRQALERDQLLLHYQPQFDLADERLVGFEALVRWRHPELGIISPADFIPLAEETGLIVPIGEWVTRTACAQNLAWQRTGLPAVTMAVNISARQFRQNDLVERISAILRETGLDPRLLELELTESMILGNTEGAILTMQALKGLGLSLAIDDFGSGYSSLAYLKRFPIAKLKIAQEFVRDVLIDSNDAAIAASVIALGKSMDLRVVAEGVETAEQLAFLRDKGCDLGQGYLFGRPLPAEAVPALFTDRRRA